eukprot:gnl/TRDRNA2_/TRDRNA2_201922_c0_seq1.p1 gnl/TRDRNA2_/TRDRNA2_201922_c0~~gnl/TRDRNA2_/TRDRNA2_201922_c0_seq1.p1  ORF type:complete len:159 (-),score=21.76 gnl/TRDRNA2_/TRDRNA2_201922_c0_seq1:484-903(-)
MPTLLTQETTDAAQDASVNSPTFEATFGMLAVPPAFSGRGVGTLLIQAAENLLVAVATQTLGTMQNSPSGTLRISIPVLSERKELFAFYLKRGYKSLRNRDDEPEDHPDFHRTINDDWVDTLRLHTFYKDLELKPSSGQ